MKKFLPVILICSIGCLSPINGQNRESQIRRPNVIVILSDDQGYGDFSCHGNPVLQTPALDKLYSESIRFGDFHVAPLCTPTRGELMTGIDAMRNGAATVLTGRNILRRDLSTMPEIFKDNGYSTGIFGKWHLGDNYPDRPMDKGFQKCIWIKGWGLLSEIEFDNDYYETRYLDGEEIKTSGEYCTNLWFNKAMEWMEAQANQNQPFFAYIAPNAPHGPFNAQIQDYDFYSKRVNDSTTALFFGLIRNIDRNMARLDEWLIRKNLKNNTLVVYLTDNGSAAGAGVYNANMRESKGSIYEGGHRAACFIRWPDGNLGQPRTISYPAQVQDILPTFIGLLNLKANIGYSFNGATLAPLLQSGKTMNDRMFVVQYGGHVRPEKYFSTVIWNNWRLVGESELYNLENDPKQEINIAGNFPVIHSRMKNFYETWWSDVEPIANSFVPVMVGSEVENPVVLHSANWTEGAVNTQWKVAMGEGHPQGGIVHIQVCREGEYRIALSRWPFHLNRRLTDRGPETSIGGTRIRAGKGLPIQYGCLAIDGKDPVIAMANSIDAREIGFEVELSNGEHVLQGWFKDQQKNDLCGAYYIKIERI